MMPTNHRQAERRLVLLVRDGRWRIDDDGHVWRLLRRGWVLAEKKLPTGYVMVRAVMNGRRVVGLAHRLVWQVLRGDILDGLVINHINGDKSDNRIENLEVVTYSENAKHAYGVLGVNPQHGEHNPMTKLSESDVHSILAARLGGDRAVDVAARFGIRYQHVYRIWKGERWSHLRPTV